MQKLPSTLTELLEQEMDRKQFIGYVGTAVLAVTGISKVSGFLTGKPKKTGSVERVVSGYGSSSYGK